MKNIWIAAFMLFALGIQSCKDEPVVDDGNNNTTDIRDVIVGEYTCTYEVFDAVSGDKKGSGSMNLKVYANSTDKTMFDFRKDGLTKFMSGANLVKVSDGYTFDIPQQEVDGFGELKGRPILNVTGQTTRVSRYYTTGNNNVTAMCEYINGGASNNDLVQFVMVKK